MRRPRGNTGRTQRAAEMCQKRMKYLQSLSEPCDGCGGEIEDYPPEDGVTHFCNKCRQAREERLRIPREIRGD